MRLLFIFLVSVITLIGSDIQPIKGIDIQASVLDMVIDNSKIYVATDASKVIILDTDLKILQEFKVRKIKDFMGTLNDADIYSIDVLNGNILFLAQAEEGYAELFLVRNGKVVKVLDKSLKLYAKAAKFVDMDHAILTLMSDEVVLYDIKKHTIVKRAKAGEYFYSSMAIDKQRANIAIGDEGGEVIVVDAKTLQRKKLIKDINKDKILSIDINDGVIAAGSRADKTLAIYYWKENRHKKIQNPDFFIYVVGLSPKNRYVVYGDNEKYHLKVLDIDQMRVVYQLVGHKNIVNVVRFADEKTIFTGSETGEIKKWRLP
ncbi:MULTISPECIES: WD40 repeat domain-containing protein [unclassified Nitratiruptor]|uniref:WD40 repeat domain-containing protein n=1 Tax=unclassified Nitratiruptor TaxID=2624044 RepID=UPI0019157650|nr:MULTISPECIES: WD40 repeat domain-containing protein [unclassified Nitratiruptor]BCD61082.1 periplasmic nitrate reductase component NapL [Nitratiruptor sp. YY08-10]BCD65015.1 periplasmic nitrate reductase component NapL [Nitratiruptor sp. YY08-14]